VAVQLLDDRGPDEPGAAEHHHPHAPLLLADSRRPAAYRSVPGDTGGA
jgi:hypothetical protein